MKGYSPFTTVIDRVYSEYIKDSAKSGSSASKARLDLTRSTLYNFMFDAIANAELITIRSFEQPRFFVIPCQPRTSDLSFSCRNYSTLTSTTRNVLALIFYMSSRDFND
jgi:hypothetical protein